MKGNKWLPGSKRVNIKADGMPLKRVSSNMKCRPHVVRGIKHVLWILLGGSQEPVGTERWEENTLTRQPLFHTALILSLTLPQTLPARPPQQVDMKTRKEASNYSIAETPLTPTASQEVAYHYSKHSDVSLILSCLYHCFTIRVPE